MTPDPPLIFDIARGSFVDGPGVRTTVFFKGCPLHCPWCHNPESQSYAKETMLFPEKCIRCGNCETGKECYALARRDVGTFYSPDELIEIILEDKPYYAHSGGGVTFSGGEPLSFIDYLSDVIPRLKRENIHIAIQTSGFFDYDAFASTILPHSDIIYYDFKIMDDENHKRIIGRSNGVILDNFKNLLNETIRVTPRVPLIPGFTTHPSNLKALADFFRQHRVDGCEFLYYNPASREKLARLKRTPSKDLPDEPVPMAENRIWIDFFKSRLREAPVRI